MTRIVSTLVELEFIQQSLDFQDEYDKKNLHLFGINEINLTLDDLAKSNFSVANIIKQKLKRD